MTNKRFLRSIPFSRIYVWVNIIPPRPFLTITTGIVFWGILLLNFPHFLCYLPPPNAGEPRSYDEAIPYLGNQVAAQTSGTRQKDEISFNLFNPLIYLFLISLYGKIGGALGIGTSNIIWLQEPALLFKALIMIHLSSPMPWGYWRSRFSVKSVPAVPKVWRKNAPCFVREIDLNSSSTWAQFRSIVR